MSYGQTWYDISATPSATSWQMIRSLRSAPPGAAHRPGSERGRTFSASLEQAEQLFLAARSVGPATSPLLIFYGLSQAGRAIAAAASGRENANGWKLVGHGITNGNEELITPGSIASLQLLNQRRGGSFTRLAEILGAASLPTPVTLGELWCLLPESAKFPLPGMGNARPLTISPARHGIRNDALLQGSVWIPKKLITPEVPLDETADMTAEYDRQRHAVRKYLSRFPSLGEWRFTTPEGQPAEVRAMNDEIAEILIEWSKAETEDDKSALAHYTTGYRSENLAFPSIGTAPQAPHPLLIWWAVLYALSKLARYSPMLWASVISVDSSPSAVAVERLLQESMVTLPELIHRTIIEVAKK
ncbi:hypothetical protein AB0F81_29835 [Actinoplanes sp. NPDC024001]|uniref:YaaC family protein n=1 Tax=Actinoplanes sp. NPDC024001 TaxID=3154598 RepID=UPI0033CAFC3D